MKGLTIALCGLLLLQSCEKYTLSRVYRSQVMHNTGGSRDTIPGSPGHPSADTIVYVSAVTVPEGYDWRRDSLYGSIPCELLFFRNGVPLFSVQTGSIASPSPDTHHILDGHLYTEYASMEGTIICRDGEELFRYPQREMLKGLLVKGKDVYTLGRALDGGGFYYRCNGETLLKQENGEPFGDFTNPAYGRNGALYESRNGVCFCYKTASACFSCVDGTVSQIQTSVGAARIKDMRLFGNSPCYAADYYTTVLVFTSNRAYTLPAGTDWNAISLFLRDGNWWFIADSPSSTVCRRVDQADDDHAGVSFTGNDNCIYMGRSHFYSARFGGGMFSISDDTGRIMYVRDSTYYFGRNTIYCEGDEIYALINPRERSQPPSVWHSGQATVYGINGYLTGVEVDVSLPSL